MSAWHGMACRAMPSMKPTCIACCPMPVCLPAALPVLRLPPSGASSPPPSPPPPAPTTRSPPPHSPPPPPPVAKPPPRVVSSPPPLPPALSLKASEVFPYCKVVTPGATSFALSPSVTPAAPGSTTSAFREYSFTVTADARRCSGLPACGSALGAFMLAVSKGCSSAVKKATLTVSGPVRAHASMHVLPPRMDQASQPSRLHVQKHAYDDDNEEVCAFPPARPPPARPPGSALGSLCMHAMLYMVAMNGGHRAVPCHMQPFALSKQRERPITQPQGRWRHAHKRCEHTCTCTRVHGLQGLATSTLSAHANEAGLPAAIKFSLKDDIPARPASAGLQSYTLTLRVAASEGACANLSTLCGSSSCLAAVADTSYKYCPAYTTRVAV